VKKGKGFKYAMMGWMGPFETSPPFLGGAQDRLTATLELYGRTARPLAKPIDQFPRGYSFALAEMEIELQAARRGGVRDVFLRQPRWKWTTAHHNATNSAPWPRSS